VLEEHPKADLRVYAVWLPMLATDERSAWDAGLLPDRRVRSYWDGDRVAGTWLARADVGELGYSGIVWDAFFVFGRGATWGGRLTGLAGSGSTVIANTSTFAGSLSGVVD